MAKKNNLVARLVRALGIFIIIGVIAVAGVLVVPNLFGAKPYVVASGSMEPDYPVGSVVLVKSVEPAEINVSDVVTFVSNGSVVTHRVVENNISEKELITKGDANEHNDLFPVEYRYVIGKVVFSLPVLGNLLQLITTLAGKAVLVGCVIFGFILTEIADKLQKKG